jgi:hypothetical protein
MHYHLLAKTKGPKLNDFHKPFLRKTLSFIYKIYDLLASRAVRIPYGFLSRHVRSSFPEQRVIMPQFNTLCRGALLYPQTATVVFPR